MNRVKRVFLAVFLVFTLFATVACSSTNDDANSSTELNEAISSLDETEKAVYESSLSTLLELYNEGYEYRIANAGYDEEDRCGYVELISEKGSVDAMLFIKNADVYKILSSHEVNELADNMTQAQFEEFIGCSFEQFLTSESISKLNNTLKYSFEFNDVLGTYKEQIANDEYHW